MTEANRTSNERLSSLEWQHLIKTKDDEIERLLGALRQVVAASTLEEAEIIALKAQGDNHETPGNERADRTVPWSAYVQVRKALNGLYGQAKLILYENQTPASTNLLTFYNDAIKALQETPHLDHVDYQMLPDQLLDVGAICDERDRLRTLLQQADELLRAAPIHHYGSSYMEWTKRREAHFVRSPVETDGDDIADAAKWRALRNCARMTAIGCAGLTPESSTYNTDYAHLTLNFWTGGKYESPGESHAREWLDGFVTKALRAMPPLEPTRNQAAPAPSDAVAPAPTPRGNLPNSLGTGGSVSQPAARSSEKATPPPTRYAHTIGGMVPHPEGAWERYSENGDGDV
jgi:hypothetical protein